MDLVGVIHALHKGADSYRMFKDAEEVASVLQRAVEHERTVSANAAAAQGALADAEAALAALAPRHAERLAALVAEADAHQAAFKAQADAARRTMVEAERVHAATLESLKAEIATITRQRDAAKREAEGEVAGLQARIQSLRAELDRLKDRAQKV